MFRFFNNDSKSKTQKSAQRVTAELQKLDSEIEKTNLKIRELYATSKIAIMNNDMNTVRIASKMRNNLLTRIENLQHQRDSVWV